MPCWSSSMAAAEVRNFDDNGGAPPHVEPYCTWTDPFIPACTEQEYA